jgi:putative tricarboxylic transport membrane protein
VKREASPPSLGARLASAGPYAVVLCGAAYLYANAGRFASLARAGELGPDFWPRAILALLILVCAGAMLRRVFLGSPAPVEPKTPTVSDRIATDDTGAQLANGGTTGEVDAQLANDEERATHPYLLLAGIGLSAAYVAGLELAGFFLATAIYLALFMAFGRYRRAGVIASVSVLGSLTFVLIFMKIVYVSLPLGVGPFRMLSVAILGALGVR